MRTKLTVFFEEPFWVGVFERENLGNYETAKIVFGAEPKDYEIYRLVVSEYSRLKFSKPLFFEESHLEKRINPKRLQREAHRETLAEGVGTKAQQALQLEYERSKKERQSISKERKEELKKLRFEKSQIKKKEKHKGH